MKNVNERSSAELELGFRTVRNRLQAPTFIAYRIDDVASGQQIRPWTAVDPAAVVRIALTATDNRILNQAAAQEERLVTITAAYGETSDDQATGEFRYVVNNLQGVS